MKKFNFNLIFKILTCLKGYLCFQNEICYLTYFILDLEEYFLVLRVHCSRPDGTT